MSRCFESKVCRNCIHYSELHFCDDPLGAECEVRGIGTRENDTCRYFERVNVTIRTFMEYQGAIERTRNVNETELINYAMGLCGEAGEFIDMIKKYKFHGHDLDMDEAVKELGDVLWYLGNLCNVLGVNLSEVAGRNVQKLEKRYPNGFKVEDSLNRVE